MQIGRKVFTTVGVLIFIFLALVAIREAFFGYTAYFVMVPGAEVFTDGKPTVGWLHRGSKGRVLILTRSVAGRTESYWIRRAGEKGSGVNRCGDWTASKFPLLAIGDVNPPCLGVTDPPQENPPKRFLLFGPHVVEFTADNGERIKIVW